MPTLGAGIHDFAGGALLLKLPAFERGDIGWCQLEPFAIGAPVRKTPMPISLNTRWIIGADGVNKLALVGQCRLNLLHPLFKFVTTPDFMMRAIFYEINPAIRSLYACPKFDFFRGNVGQEFKDIGKIRSACDPIPQLRYHLGF